jgi:RNA polymerase sigma-70 factor (ECF subfamily)
VVIVGENQLAQEVTQDTFMRVWLRAEQYRFEQGQFATWLLTIARHIAIDRLRKESRQPPRPISIDRLNGQMVNQLATDDLPHAQDLRPLLNDLPTEQREVIVLAYYKGLSQREIAEHLRLPLGTVKSRLRLAMQKLRDAWFAPLADPNQ